MEKPTSLRQAVIQTFRQESLSIDQVAAKLGEPRDRVRTTVEKLVAKKIVEVASRTAGKRYVYKIAETKIPAKTDFAAAWMFNSVE